MEKCKYCGGSGELNYGPNKEIDPTGLNIICGCDVCDGTGEFIEDKYTCSKCSDKDTCPFAFDAYNTDDCCLASK
jgi:DnaJ-class molecular chaperone